MRAIDRRMFGLATAAAVAAGTLAKAAATATPEPVDEGLFVPINGMDHWITLRGHDRRNPVILFLHGGPGLASTGNAPVFASWEQDFTVVQWDQPGGGATFAKNMAADQGPYTQARYLADAVAVAEWTRRRLGRRKLIIMGASWGTQLGALLVAARPDLAAAFVGAGFAVSRRRGDQIGYDLALERARARGDTVAVAGLEKVGPPPYRTVDEWFVRQQHTNPPGQPMAPAEVAATAEAARLTRAVDPAQATWIAKGLPDFNVFGQFLAVQRATYADTRDYEAPLRFKAPLFIIQGSEDLNTPTPLAKAYLEQVKAPAKAYLEIAGGGHNITIFHREILAFLTAEVRPAALARGA
ncbi:alpha/beta hydrolase [uncultured Phenylobacterium sp.]|uniref:alpha/beta hydrolase n=1 Tax=uncultured Phenylobacterium sp. TaxID=349273 RepID=UPI0025CF5827|nr:alpha/beta hydrolase [uncultured Phenylobacterium sp.]